MKQGRRRRKERAKEGKEEGRQDEVTVALAAHVSLCYLHFKSGITKHWTNWEDCMFLNTASYLLHLPCAYN